jgi:cholesterol oxidase
MSGENGSQVFDFAIIGSGFGGSVSAMRLTEKGYSVVVLERGKRFEDQDFAKSTWNVFRYLWAPALRCFGVLQISLFKDVLVLHGSGVGGGSLGYANVLMQPTDELFDNPSWRDLADWKAELQPHYDTARRMLGVADNPCFWPADRILQNISKELGTEQTFRPTTVGTFFGKPGEEGKEVPDPFFNGQGPARSGCTHCGACMVGCRYNSKNTLVKNYLFFAEKWGAKIWPEVHVDDVRPLPEGQADGARYEVVYHKTTAWLSKATRVVRVRNVVFSAGSLGTQRLLFRCRDVTRSLPRISQRLGSMVRTNSEALLGSTSRETKDDFSKGIAITSIFYADPVTTIEPVRYPAGSSLMRFLSGPMVEDGGGFASHLFKTLGLIIRHPIDFMRTHILPGWASRSTIMLVMQTEDNRINMHLGRSFWTLFKTGLVSDPDSENSIPTRIDIGHQVTRRFASKTNGIPAGTLNEGLLGIPMTAHILGGVPFGRNEQEGVIDLDCQIYNYPGLYVVDGSIMPGNPGVNPSLTITALSEYALSRMPVKPGAQVRPPLWK